MTTGSAQTNTSGTRERLMRAMLHGLRTRGFHGVGLNELLAEAEASKGVLYHHFPGGKTELAVATIEQVAQRITSSLHALLQKHDDPVDALGAWLNGAQKTLQTSRYEAGCPLAAIALESTPADTTIRAAVARAFDAIRMTLAAALAAKGLDEQRASSFAALAVSAYEGGLIQARVAASRKPFQDSAQMLLAVLQQSLCRPGREAGTR